MLHKVKHAPTGLKWYPGDVLEAENLFGWQIDRLLEKSFLDVFYVTYDDVIVSVFGIDEHGMLTYFVTEEITKIPIRKYLTWLRDKLHCYLRLVDFMLVTEVASDYAEGIFTLKMLGFENISSREDRDIYGKQLENSNPA